MIGAEEMVARFGEARVVVVGDLMLDEYLWGTVRRISPEAPIPVVEVERTTHAPGGAANVAANIASLGGRVNLVGVVGDDGFGERLQGDLSERRVDIGAVMVDPARTTTVKTRVVAHSQQVVRVDREVREPLGPVLARQIIESVGRLLERADVILLSDYDKGVLTPTVTTALVAQAVHHGVPVLVDPKGLDFSKYRGATLVTPNLGEAARATRIEIHGEAGVRAAGAELLRDLQSQGVLVTCGEQGMWLFEQGRPARHFGPRAREVYDVTGAGDTVVSVVALALAVRGSFELAARIASEAAGVVVGKVGTATLSRSELLAALAAAD